MEELASQIHMSDGLALRNIGLDHLFTLPLVRI